MCVLASFCGVVTAVGTLISIVTGYCTDNPCEELETLSFMSREQPYLKTISWRLHVSP